MMKVVKDISPPATLMDVVIELAKLLGIFVAFMATISLFILPVVFK
jgi:hypothetical protein